MSEESNQEIFATIARVATPMVLSSFFIMFAEQINYIFVCDLNDQYTVAALGLGNMLVNLFAISTTLGANTAMETLVSQAHGTRNEFLCGLWLNRGRVLLVFIFVPISLILLSTPWLLKLLG